MNESCYSSHFVLFYLVIFFPIASIEVFIMHVQEACSTEDFLKRLQDHDGEIEKLRKEAESTNEVTKVITVLMMQ